MKRKEKMEMESSSDDEDSDVEKNFTLFTQKGGRDEEQQHEEEEEDEGDEEEEDEGDEDEGGEEEEEEEGSESEEEDEPSDDDDDDEDEDDNDDGGCRDPQTSDDIKRELSHMSFEDVMKLQNQVGTKVYNEVAHGRTTTKQKTTKRRLNKNRPMEMSAKKPAPFLRQVVSVQKTTLRDPRFDDLSGEYKPEIFEKTYRFINDIKQKEKQVVQRQLKKMKKKNNNQKKEKLQFLLKRMENQERARQSQEQRRERELQFKRQQRERANQGARPFFLKESDKKKLHLAEKYEELKKSGKLENFLSKKRKRNAGKDRRKLPQRPQQHSKAV